MTGMNPDSDQTRSAGFLFSKLTEHLSSLFRSEIALVKLELRETVRKLGAGGGLLAGAILCVMGTAVFLVVTLVLVLALWMPHWIATLLVAILLALTAAILVVLGRKKLREVEFLPAATADHVRTDLELIKSDLQRMKENRSHG